MVKINTNARLHNIDVVFVFTKQCQQVYYINTPSFRKHHSRVDWLFVIKTKPRDHVQVVQDDNDEVNARDDIFQLDDLVNPYWVASSTYFKENSNLLKILLLMLMLMSWMIYWQLVDLQNWWIWWYRRATTQCKRLWWTWRWQNWRKGKQIG